MKYVLAFRTKNETFASPFAKRRLEKYDDGARKAFLVIIEDSTLERAWKQVLRCCFDYQSAMEKTIDKFNKVPSRTTPDLEVEPDIDHLAKIL